MLSIHHGDLLQSDCTVIGHQANCFATMGAGIAKQIAKRYPEAFQTDKEYPVPVGSRERLGSLSYAWHRDQRLIFNLYGQYHYGRGKQTDYEAFRSALRSMFHHLEGMEDQDFIKVGLPYNIGCGLAGGDWKRIESIIYSVSEQFQRGVHLYKL
ncbi:macro domain-containing protein [Desmospora activa]|uniref:O-acetyl-ADP-ribose deacetylase (Regulator of RNase III) n=1 Tax=Desmospora activa DSM 45169 TaxID=1121389 RepID=A0A2T4Z7A9_9BACL|nr:macro domain-containing protein [Desmospora activa]PTM57745.1 O-acetyl-ADP-ribose deacetylase (regulator of RNase III) [Desmospora activa DSM 45169]